MLCHVCIGWKFLFGAKCVFEVCEHLAMLEGGEENTEPMCREPTIWRRIFYLVLSQKLEKNESFLTHPQYWEKIGFMFMKSAKIFQEFQGKRFSICIWGQQVNEPLVFPAVEKMFPFHPNYLRKDIGASPPSPQGSDARLMMPLHTFQQLTGSTGSPKNIWSPLKGMNREFFPQLPHYFWTVPPFSNAFDGLFF